MQHGDQLKGGFVCKCNAPFSVSQEDWVNESDICSWSFSIHPPLAHFLIYPVERLHLVISFVVFVGIIKERWHKFARQLSFKPLSRFSSIEKIYEFYWNDWDCCHAFKSTPAQKERDDWFDPDSNELDFSLLIRFQRTCYLFRLHPPSLASDTPSAALGKLISETTRCLLS
jgi:hypothetical protein